MRTTIDGAGRIVVPKRLRDELGLTAGTALEITAAEGRLEIEPPPPEVHIRLDAGRPVIDAPEATGITVEDVRALRLRELDPLDRADG